MVWFSLPYHPGSHHALPADRPPGCCARLRQALAHAAFCRTAARSHLSTDESYLQSRLNPVLAPPPQHFPRSLYDVVNLSLECYSLPSVPLLWPHSLQCVLYLSYHLPWTESYLRQNLPQSLRQCMS